MLYISYIVYYKGGLMQPQNSDSLRTILADAAHAPPSTTPRVISILGRQRAPKPETSRESSAG